MAGFWFFVAGFWTGVLVCVALHWWVFLDDMEDR